MTRDNIVWKIFYRCDASVWGISRFYIIITQGSWRFGGCPSVDDFSMGSSTFFFLGNHKEMFYNNTEGLEPHKPNSTIDRRHAVDFRWDFSANTFSVPSLLWESSEEKAQVRDGVFHSWVLLLPAIISSILRISCDRIQ